jgi:hypothetical protein
VTSSLRFFNSWDDENQIQALVREMPENLSYEGEFGPEIVSFIPFIYNLNLRGLLEKRTVTTYSGMRPYYGFLRRGQLIEVSNQRTWIPFEERWWPNSNEHLRIPTAGESYPRYQVKKNQKSKILLIQNKFCSEWGEGPINFLSLEMLDEIFRETRYKCKVVYSRQGILSNENSLGISIDHNVELRFRDLELCKKYPHVKILEKHNFLNLRSYNSKKLYWINRAFLLAGVQGGGNFPWAYFNKDAIILHKSGRETELSYDQGFYKYLSNPPLNLKVTACDEDFLKFLVDKVSKHLEV